MSEQKKCFVIMPISDLPPYESGHFERVYNYIIRPAVIKAGFIPIRADEVQKTNFIILDILKQIVNSSMCVCDLSSRNPNVLYELGIRQAFRLPVTLIRDSQTSRIFDIQGLRDIEYDENLRIDNVNSVIDSISATIINTYNDSENDINSLINLLGILPAKIKLNGKDSEQGGGNSKKYDLESCVNRFISDKSVEGLSKATLKGYRYHLNYLMTYTNKNVNEFTKEDIKQFLTDRENNSNFSSKSTIQTVRSVLKSFFGWLVQEQLIDVNPVNRVKPFKRQEAYIEALSDTDLSKIKSACISLREKALIEVLCSTGCTLNEIPNLEKSRINWEENELVIRSNSRGKRSVFLTAQAIIFIKEYLESRTDDCKELFVTERRPYKKIGDRSIQKQIAQIIERTDLNKKISARTFRHTFAQSMLKKGCPVNVIQALLGSKDFATTAVTYFRLTSENKKQIYNNYY